MTPTHSDQVDKKKKSMRERYLPHPVLTLVMVFVWMALLNDVSLGTLTLAVILGVSIPIYTSNFWPNRPVVRSPLNIVIYLVVLLWDITVANLEVAYLILFRGNDQLRSGWICVPLELRNAEAITVLAATITLTPGTVSSDLSADGRSLLVHCLDIDNAEATVARIKERYEQRLRKIFP